MIPRLTILTCSGRIGIVSCVVSRCSAIVINNLSSTSTKSSISVTTSKTSSAHYSLAILCSTSIILLVTLHCINILSPFHHEFISPVIILIMSHRFTKSTKQVFRGLNIFLQQVAILWSMTIRSTDLTLGASSL